LDKFEENFLSKMTLFFLKKIKQYYFKLTWQIHNLASLVTMQLMTNALQSSMIVVKIMVFSMVFNEENPNTCSI